MLSVVSLSFREGTLGFGGGYGSGLDVECRMQFLGRSIEWKISIYASVKTDKYDPELVPLRCTADRPDVTTDDCHGWLLDDKTVGRVGLLTDSQTGDRYDRGQSFTQERLGRPL
jgi:hypothetical protein